MAEVKGLSPDAEIETNTQGGKQSAVGYAFHLLPVNAMFGLAGVLKEGLVKYDRDNWRKISAEEHINHMIGHALGIMAGDTSDDHFGHMLCRAAMAYECQSAGNMWEDGHPPPFLSAKEEPATGQIIPQPSKR